MANENEFDNVPHAAVVRKKSLRISVVWIIPILAGVVALGIAIQRERTKGPVITIAIKAAAGIEAGKTFIKYKDVTIGQVTAVDLSEDFSEVIVTAQIAKHAEGLIVDDAKFWVVEPHVSLAGVSGLSTLLSGQYIGFQAGSLHTSSRHFTALTAPPVFTDQPGSRIRLRAKALGSIGIGAPVYYHSFNVGHVEAQSLAVDGQSIETIVFIYAPYDKYVTSETRFWNASGIDVSAGANGVEIRTESILSVLVGGIAFDAPEFLPPGGPIIANALFPLYPNRATAMIQPDAIEKNFVLYFNESLRGLSVGAPVTLFGMTVGHVSEVGLTYNPKTLNLRPRVLVTFYPERLSATLPEHDKENSSFNVNSMTPAARAQLMKHLVEDSGLRAQLQTGSLITGDLYVSFDLVPNAPKVKVDWSLDPLELPVASGGFASIEAKLNSILTKVDNMPLGAMGNNLNATIATLNQTLKNADILLKHVDADLVPEGTKTLASLHQTIVDADRVLVGKDSPTAQDLHDMMQELTNTARSVRVFVEYLEQHPSILIRGKSKENP